LTFGPPLRRCALGPVGSGVTNQVHPGPASPFGEERAHGVRGAGTKTREELATRPQPVGSPLLRFVVAVVCKALGRGRRNSGARRWES
jgi:hypothetical protein